MTFPLNRREFLAIGSASAVASLVNPPAAAAEPAQQISAPSQAGAKTRWQRQAEHQLELAKNVTPMTHEPLYFIRRRGGDHFVDEAELYERMYEPENIRRMADAGVRYAMLHFYKGFGLEYENAQIEETRRAAELMHQLGMKVGLYFAGTILWLKYRHWRDSFHLTPKFDPIETVAFCAPRERQLFVRSCHRRKRGASMILPTGITAPTRAAIFSSP